MGNCERCYYFTPRQVRADDDMGCCHRYPQGVVKDRIARRVRLGFVARSYPSQSQQLRLGGVELNLPYKREPCSTHRWASGPAARVLGLRALAALRVVALRGLASGDGIHASSSRDFVGG